MVVSEICPSIGCPEIRGGRGCQLESGLLRGRVNTGETDNATVVAYSSALCCALSGGDN